MSAMTLQQKLVIALAHHQSGRLVEAESLYRQILAEHPFQPDALHLMGMLAYQAKNYPVAVQLIQQAIARLPSPDFYANLGLVFAAMANHPQSEASYSQAVRLKPDYAEAHLGLGVARFHQRDLEGAIEACRRAIQLNPNLADAYNNLGNALKDSGNPHEAMECYRKALSLRPDDAEVTVNLGEALHYSGQLEQAIDLLRRATKLDPNLEQGFSQLGAALRDNKDFDGAHDAYRRALRLGTAKSVIYKSLAAYLDGK